MECVPVAQRPGSQRAVSLLGCVGAPTHAALEVRQSACDAPHDLGLRLVEMEDQAAVVGEDDVGEVVWTEALDGTVHDERGHTPRGQQANVCRLEGPDMAASAPSMGVRLQSPDAAGRWVGNDAGRARAYGSLAATTEGLQTCRNISGPSRQST